MKSFRKVGSGGVVVALIAVATIVAWFGAARAQEPVQIVAEFALTGSTTQAGSGPVYTVPDGHRLVIEQITVRALTPAADQTLALEIYTELRNTVGAPTPAVRHMVGIVPPMGPGIRVHALGQLVRFYADPGTRVSLLADRFAHGHGSLGGEASLHVTLIGHLMPLS